MSDVAGVLLALLAIVGPLVLAWWMVARGVKGRQGKPERRHGKIPR